MQQQQIDVAALSLIELLALSKKVQIEMNQLKVNDKIINEELARRVGEHEQNSTLKTGE